MNSSTKRILSTIAIIIASVAFGVVVSADLGLMRTSNAQSSAIQTTSSAAPVASVTIPSFADVAARVMPAVVSITSTEVIKANDPRNRNPFGGDPFEFFFPNPNGQRNPHGSQTPEDEEHKQVAGGSGFIISPDGYIVTNNHVIDGASRVQVHWGADENGNGGHTSEAKIIGRDPATDIALLKIDAGKSLPSVPLGDSDRIRKGDWAIAIGNPYQFENTLTVGVISAKGRALGLSDQTKSFENFIQTDAAINFGNSGGPLMNINGEVIGINTAIRGGGAQGLGFATPINTAKRLLPQLRQGKVTRGYLGMGIIDLTDDARSGFELPPDAHGALVQTVEPGLPAEKAGVMPGDLIIAADGHPIASNRALIDYISYLPVGSKVDLTVIRDNKSRDLTASTVERNLEADKQDATKPEEIAPARNKLGMSVQELTPQLRQQYGLADTLTGVLVTGVKEVSPAGDVLTEGDVISEVQGVKITNLAQFRSAIEHLKGGQVARIYVTSAAGRGSAAIAGYRFIHVPA
jgi:serine protease Do